MLTVDAYYTDYSWRLEQVLSLLGLQFSLTRVRFSIIIVIIIIIIIIIISLFIVDKIVKYW